MAMLNNQRAWQDVLIFDGKSLDKKCWELGECVWIFVILSKIGDFSAAKQGILEMESKHQHSESISDGFGQSAHVGLHSKRTK